MAYKFVLACGLLQLVFAAERKWEYIGSKGPSEWYKDYPDCKEKRQSPIDLVGDLAQYDTKLTEFEFHDYDSTSGFTMTLENDGHTAKVNMDGGAPHKIKDGGLPDTFRLAQYHFHWGSDDTKGCEHTVNGNKYPLELHFVHYAEKYDSMKGLISAVNETEGLAVLGVLFEIGDLENEHFNAVLNHFENITYEDEKISIPLFKLNSLMPQNLDKYWRYSGSLTTPACYESVIWTVFQETVKISNAQMAKFRMLKHIDLAGNEAALVDTFRPVQMLEGRIVYTSVSVSSATSLVNNKTVLLAVFIINFVKLSWS